MEKVNQATYIVNFKTEVSNCCEFLGTHVL